MKKVSRKKSGFVHSRNLIACLLLLCGLSLAVASYAATKKQRRRPAAPTPASGTISDATPNLSYTDGPFVVPNATAQAGEPICTLPMSCSDFGLTVGSIVGAANKQIQISVGWPVSSADFDVYIYAGSPATGSPIATSASSADPEIVVLPATVGTYTVRVVPFAPAGQTYTGTVSILSKTPPPPPGTAPPARYLNYPAPDSAAGAESAGEPSIGVDWNPNVPSLKNGPNPPNTTVTPVMNNINLNTGGVAFFTANLNEFRVDFDDCASPAKNAWTDVTFATVGVETLDPIGFVDHQLPTTSGIESGTGLGRVFQDQLAGATSILAYSDDDGATYTQSQGSGQPAGVDHQTVGGGPYNENAVIPPVHPLYRHQIYYASQDIGTAFAARSDDGGLTFGPGVPMWNITQCGGLHGHVKVGPDGTVYVPNKSCTDGGDASMGASVAVSRDNGITWTVKQIRDTVQGYVAGSGDSDPSVGVGADGTVYVGYQNSDGHPHIAVSSNFGDSWHDVDVSQGVVQNTVFPEVIAGDGDRAAFGFLGTSTGGGYTGTATFTGVWYFYIATTVDRGQTYTLVDATNGDPVQIGSICTGGTTCGGDRNLLDFNDLQLDSEGRVLAGYADGCVGPGCNAGTAAAHAPPYDESRSALASIIRQSGGPRLLSAFDPQANCTESPLTCNPTAPAAPRVDSVAQDSTGIVHVNWSQPDNGGSPLTGYKVYRKDSIANTYAVIATVTVGCPACKTSYDDATATTAGATYTYKVTALNAQDESAFCGEFPVGAQTIAESRCALPGITLFTDAAGDETDMVAQSDIQKLSIAEPYNATLPNKHEAFFSLKVANLAPTPVPSRRWTVLFNRGSTQWFVAMQTDNTGLPTYVYGHTSVGPGGVTMLNADGTPDFGSETSDGTITIGIGTPTTNAGAMAFPPLVSGEQFTAITANTQASLVLLLVADDSAGTASYTLAGNSSCAPNAAPVAALSASLVGQPNNPPMGDPPLAVHFDASASSDPDPGDSIVSYTFTFGDGSPAVTQASPTTDHTYTSNGNFTAKVTVTDSHNTVSGNVAQVEVEVETPLDRVVSEKTHGGAGTFDVILFDLNVHPNGTGDVECRNGTSYTVIYTFGPQFTVTGPATTVTASNGGSVASHGAGPGAHQYQVQFTGVTNAQTHNITLNGVPVNNSDTTANGGNATLNSIIGRLDLLVGDTNNDRTVNGIDVSQTKSRSGQAVGTSNFRSDANVDGALNAIDSSLVKTKSGTALP